MTDQATNLRAMQSYLATERALQTSSNREAAKLEPVMVEATPKPLRRILVAVDGSDQARWALEVGIHLATTTGAELALVHVVNMVVGWAPGLRTSVLTGLEEEGAELLHRLVMSVPSPIRTVMLLRHGYPDREIVAASREWEADLVILGTHARGMVSRFFRLLGGVAEYVIRYADCPVMTVSHQPAASLSLVQDRGRENAPAVEEDALVGAGV
jgi:nucleotide-binding universal stress UspA family protein